jgi:hypothetical protein
MLQNGREINVAWQQSAFFEIQAAYIESKLRAVLGRSESELFLRELAINVNACQISHDATISSPLSGPLTTFLNPLALKFDASITFRSSNAKRTDY